MTINKLTFYFYQKKKKTELSKQKAIIFQQNSYQKQNAVVAMYKKKKKLNCVDGVQGLIERQCQQHKMYQANGACYILFLSLCYVSKFL